MFYMKNTFVQQNLEINCRNQRTVTRPLGLEAKECTPLHKTHGRQRTKAEL